MTRRTLIIVFLVLALGYVNYLAISSETQIAEGRTVLLELAPVDPRSLLQGDFMRLGYDVERQLSERTFDSDKGKVILTLDRFDVGQLTDFYTDGMLLEPNQVAVNYRGSRWNATIAPDSFLFQEGQGAVYAEAEYAEVKVTADGRVFLVGLRDGDFRPISPQ